MFTIYKIFPELGKAGIIPLCRFENNYEWLEYYTHFGSPDRKYGRHCSRWETLLTQRSIFIHTVVSSGLGCCCPLKFVFCPFLDCIICFLVVGFGNSLFWMTLELEVYGLNTFPSPPLTFVSSVSSSRYASDLFLFWVSATSETLIYCLACDLVLPWWLSRRGERGPGLAVGGRDETQPYFLENVPSSHRSKDSQVLSATGGPPPTAEHRSQKGESVFAGCANNPTRTLGRQVSDREASSDPGIFRVRCTVVVVSNIFGKRLLERKSPY